MQNNCSEANKGIALLSEIVKMVNIDFPMALKRFLINEIQLPKRNYGRIVCYI